MDNKRFKELRRNALDGMELPRNIYNLVIGAVVLFGLIINIIMATVFIYPILRMPYWLVLILYLIGSFASMHIVYKSNSPVVSFLGFTGLSVSMGLLLTYYLTYFEIGSIIVSFAITAVVTIIMTILSACFPNLFRKIGPVLGIALLAVLIVEIILVCLLGLPGTIFDIIVALIFCGYIGFDWVKAQDYPSTLNNAVDSSADIYVDIVNLFIRILSIVGKDD